MTLAEVEDYRLAKNKVAPFGMSLLSAVEEWIVGRGKIPRVISKTVAEVVEEFLTAKRVEGVSSFRPEDRKYRMNKFAAAFPGRIEPHDFLTAQTRECADREERQQFVGSVRKEQAQLLGRVDLNRTLRATCRSYIFNNGRFRTV